MWGIIPAEGVGAKIQLLAFSKELLPVGSRLDDETELPRAELEVFICRRVEALHRGEADDLEFLARCGRG